MNQQELEQKLNKIKDEFIVDIFNLVQRAINNISEIQKESKELEEETKIPIKKGEK